MCSCSYMLAGLLLSLLACQSVVCHPGPQAYSESATVSPPVVPDLLVARNNTSALPKSIRNAASLRRYSAKCPPDAPDKLHSREVQAFSRCQQDNADRLDAYSLRSIQHLLAVAKARLVARWMAVEASAARLPPFGSSAWSSAR